MPNRSEVNCGVYGFVLGCGAVACVFLFIASQLNNSPQQPTAPEPPNAPPTWVAPDKEECVFAPGSPHEVRAPVGGSRIIGGTESKCVIAPDGNPIFLEDNQ